MQLTFALPDPQDCLGFGAPTTHIKIRRPNSCILSKTYSLTSPPTDRGRFQITVKVYRGGNCSGYLAGLNVGDCAHVSRTMTKTMRVGARDPPVNVGLIAFGIGITEMLVTAEDLLRAGHSVTLLYANRHSRDILFEDELSALSAAGAGRFSVVHVLSRTCDIPHGVAGRPSAEVLSGYFSQWEPRSAYFLAIGSKKMMRDTYAILGKLGFKQRLLGRPTLLP